MSRENVMVTVIMLCYNHEKYIRQALNSVLNQKTAFPYEIIVHDDASTDRSADILKEFAEMHPDRIRPIIQTENQYQKKVPIRRTFIDPLIRGKYVAFCECDDYWTDENKLQRQVDFLEAHPEFVAVTHNCRIVDGNGNDIDKAPDIYRPYRAHVYTLERLSLGAAFPGQTASIVCRHSAYDISSCEWSQPFAKIRIPTGDKRLFLQLLLQGDIYCLEERMSAHRIVTHGGDSWSARNHGKNLSFERHAAAIDSRRFVKQYFGKKFCNCYTIFHTGLAAIVKFIRNPSEENRQVYRQLVAEHRCLPGTCIYLLGMGLLSIPSYFKGMKEITRYDSQK